MKNIINKTLFFLTICIIISSCNSDDCDYDCTKEEKINISTGIDPTGTALTIGNVDTNWQVVSSPYPAGTPALNSSTYGVWQPTPVATTNAGWINCTGANCCTNLPGDYIFERPFTIAPGTVTFTCDFGITQDDSFIFAELVAPDASTIPLIVVPTSAYQLSLPITNFVTNPLAGTWKIRVKVNFFDVGAGFLTSGYIKTVVPCNN